MISAGGRCGKIFRQPQKYMQARQVEANKHGQRSQYTHPCAHHSSRNLALQAASASLSPFRPFLRARGSGPACMPLPLPPSFLSYLAVPAPSLPPSLSLGGAGWWVDRGGGRGRRVGRGPTAGTAGKISSLSSLPSLAPPFSPA